MNIAVITSGFLPVPPTKGGAVENLLYNLIKYNEKEMKVNFNIFSIYDEKAEEEAKKLKYTKIRFYKINYFIKCLDKMIFIFEKYILKKKNSQSYRFILQRLSFLNKISKDLKENDYDKVLLENHPTQYLALKWRKNYIKYKDRYYYHCHNEFPGEYGCDEIIKKTNKIICVSKYIQSSLEKYDIPKEKLLVLRNGVDENKFNSKILDDEKQKIREKYAIKKDDIVLIYTGRIVPEKGVLELVKAFKQIKKDNLKLLIVGSALNAIKNKTLYEERVEKEISKNMNIGQNNFHYGVWSTRTVDDILKNPNYIGNLTQCKQKKINYKSKKRIHNVQKNWITALNAIPRIIDDSLFNLVEDMFKSNKNRTKEDGITNSLLLRGLIFCKECKHTFGFRAQYQDTKKYGKVCRIYGNCNYWAKRKKQRVCTPHSVKYNEIEDVVLEQLKDLCNKYIDSNELKNNLIKSNKLQLKKENYNIEILKLENNINILNKKIGICYNDKLDGNISLDMYKRTYNNFVNEIKANECKIDEFKRKIYNIENNKTYDDDFLINRIQKFLNMENSSRSLIASLIDRIEISEDNKIDIYYKFKII